MPRPRPPQAPFKRYSTRTSSRTASSSTPPRSSYKPLPSSALPIRSLVALALPLLGYATYIFSAPPETLNPSTFTPFTLIHHQRISSTSSILTLRPCNSPSAATDPYAAFWTHGTWSLELKHPALQIARRYTPLPPSLIPSRTSTLSADAASLPVHQPGDVRLLVRKYETGEVSRYLHSLKVGATVEVRGGYAEFELPREARKVLFLAGGTGVAPAMQVAGAMARRGMGGDEGGEESLGREMRIMWANRRREEVGEAGEGARAEEEANEMVGMVQDLEAKAERVADVSLRTSYFVDEDNRFIQQKDLVEALASFEAPSAGTAGAGGAVGHEKLILLSGPDGFVEYFAGPKRLRNGVEVTGLTGGLLSQMKLDGWTVVRF